MDAFLAQLVTVATSPYAFVAYVVLVAVWGVVFVKVTRVRALAQAIGHVPEADRRALLEKDYGFHLQRGMSARDFLRAQRSAYIFYGLMALLLAAVVLATLALLKANPAPADARLKATQDALGIIVGAIDDDFAAIRGSRAEDADSTAHLFDSTVILPASKYNYVDLEPGEPPAFLASLYHGEDKRVAFTTYQQFISQLRTLYPDWLETAGALTERHGLNDYGSFVKGYRKIIVSLDQDDENAKDWHVMVMIKRVDRAADDADAAQGKPASSSASGPVRR